MITTTTKAQDTWHTVTDRDQHRIECLVCQFNGITTPAQVCQHYEWKAGGMRGLSFFYYCAKHGAERGYRDHAS
jgi:hypothetical protein